MKTPYPEKLIFLLVLCFAVEVYTFPQQNCSKPKLYVSVGYPEDPFFSRQMYDDYVSKGYQIQFDNEKEYLRTIMDLIVTELRQRAGEVNIIPLEEKIFIDDKPETPQEENAFSEHPSGEYHLQYLLCLMARDQGTPGPDGTIHPNYWSVASIGDADLDGKYVKVCSYEYPDLFGSISRTMSNLCGTNLKSVLDQYEATHFNALREGKAELKVLSPGYVSPEPEEQKITIRVTTSDCRKNSGEGTNLWFLYEKDRGSFTPGLSSTSFQIGNTWRAQTSRNGVVEIQYQLKRGDEAFRENLNVELACRGQKRTSNDIFFTAKTLRVEVIPEQAIVAPGETTRIFVRLYKVDDKGSKEPVKDRTLHLKISGINDGTIRPATQVTTNANGEGVIEYTAGQKDKKIHIEASYKPQHFETTFTGSADLGGMIYSVSVDLDYASPFIPDGSMSIAKLGLHADFERVVIEPGGNEPAVSSFGDIDADEGKGKFTVFELNNVWTEGDNIEHPKFIKRPPASFGATLTLALDEDAIQKVLKTNRKTAPAPPEKMKLSFFTDMDLQEIQWGCSTGSAAVGFYEFQVKFEVPWKDLLAGKPVTVTAPYESDEPNEKGTWTIRFNPLKQ